MTDNQNLKLTPGVSRDNVGNLCGGFFVEDEHGNKMKYEYKFIAMVGSKANFIEQMEDDYKQNGFENFRRLD